MKYSCAFSSGLVITTTTRNNVKHKRGELSDLRRFSDDPHDPFLPRRRRHQSSLLISSRSSSSSSDPIFGVGNSDDVGEEETTSVKGLSGGVSNQNDEKVMIHEFPFNFDRDEDGTDEDFDQVLAMYEELGRVSIDDELTNANEKHTGNAIYLDDDDEEVGVDELMDMLEGLEKPEAKNKKKEVSSNDSGGPESPVNTLNKGASLLERALLEGVVPVSAGVGSDCLPGDASFDPLGLAQKDYVGNIQQVFVSMIPSNDDEEVQAKPLHDGTTRPSALILRDYRECEIRHGRLAMLAAIFWPVQEMLDQLLLDDKDFGGLIHGTGVTLPFVPLFMTLIMLLLGYLDVYSQAIKDMQSIGDAFLPGDCFWDPLRMLEGAPDRMKRNMQERELWNGRIAMLAIACFAWEESLTHVPLISIESNRLLFEPAYEIPDVRNWLDAQFESPSPIFTYPNLGTVDYVETLKEASTPVVEDVPVVNVSPETILDELKK